MPRQVGHLVHQIRTASAAAEATEVDNERAADEEIGEQKSRRRIEQDCSKHRVEDEGSIPAKQVRFDPDTQIPGTKFQSGKNFRFTHSNFIQYKSYKTNRGPRDET